CGRSSSSDLQLLWRSFRPLRSRHQVNYALPRVLPFEDDLVDLAADGQVDAPAQVTLVRSLHGGHALRGEAGRQDLFDALARGQSRTGLVVARTRAGAGGHQVA